jgi:hypothetical protein
LVARAGIDLHPPTLAEAIAGIQLPGGLAQRHEDRWQAAQGAAWEALTRLALRLSTGRPKTQPLGAS